MPVSTIEPGSSSFQLLRVRSGVHRTVTEPLLPSLQHISLHAHQKANRETNMFRHFPEVLLAKAVRFRWSPAARACSSLPQFVAAAKSLEVIR
jgi:hypothetical protein